MFKNFINKLTKKSKDLNKTCTVVIKASFDLTDTIDIEFDSSDQLENNSYIYLNDFEFNMGSNNVKFLFKQRWSRMKTKDNCSTTMEVLLYGECIYLNPCDIKEYAAKYLSNVYDIVNIKIHSDEYIQLYDFTIEDITFIDGNKNKFKVHKRVIDEYNKKTNGVIDLDDSNIRTE